MNPYPKTTAVADPFPAQQAYVAIEQKSRDAAEKRRLQAVRQHVQAHTHTTDLRGLAGAVKKLLGPGYEVGCGSAHIWVRREGEQQRLAIVADRLTSAYRDWFEPLPDAGATSRTLRKQLPRLGESPAAGPS
ncbi:hypothetical protein F0P96_20830 [Hymenobacter busanensis]|uniref:Uncharacterized protein n=1 Tax=Hymenobacter busanensis TaxID=2607656 RepID=A0AA88FID9_9BACT|nr:hypothetical protein [Hymenobacter busanensis]KAA9325145.1 hypothetical protein F0P96_20830 [Hymenobacter busanensis]